MLKSPETTEKYEKQSPREGKFGKTHSNKFQIERGVFQKKYNLQISDFVFTRPFHYHHVIKLSSSLLSLL